MPVHWGPIPPAPVGSGNMPPPGASGTIIVSDGHQWDVVLPRGAVSLIQANGNFILGNTGVTPGTYGDSDHIAQFTVGQDGRLTFAGVIPVSGNQGPFPVSGDLSGTTLNARVIGFDGFPIGAGVPTSGSMWIYDGVHWNAVTIQGDATVAADGTLTTVEFRRQFFLMGG